VGLALYTFLSLYGLFLWRHDRHPAWLVMAGLFGGWSVGVKYTGGIALAAGALLIAGNYRLSDWRPLFKALAQYGIPAVLILAPWLIKNIVYVGNPVFPFFYKWGAARLNPWVGHAAAGYFAGLSEYQARPLWALPGLLLQAAAHGMHFGGGMDVLGDFGWAPLIAFLPALALKSARSAPVRWLLVYAGLFFIPWGMTRPVLRFMMPLAPVLALLSAHALMTGTERAGSLIRWLARAGVTAAVTSGLLIFMNIAGLLSSFSVISGLEDRDAYLSRKLDYYGAAQFINRELNDGQLALVVGDQRSYYYSRPVLVTPVFNSNPLAGSRSRGVGATAPIGRHHASRGELSGNGTPEDLQYLAVFAAGIGQLAASFEEPNPLLI